MLLPLLLTACNDYAVSQKVEEEAFEQDGGNLTVDVLWVVDNSQTMTEEQDMLTANLSTFVDALESFGADWQIGIVTTDVEREDAGELVGGIFTPDSTIEDVAAAFNVGAEGDRTEQGLLSMQLATTDPALSGANAGFIRSDADLGVAIVADEDDQSPGEVSSYTEHLKNLKGAGHARAAAIVGQLPQGCESPSAAADPAPRYLELVEATSGRQDSICLTDFTEVMQELALSALGLNDTFPLAAVPDLSSVEVKVDGVLIYRRDTDGWSYDAGHNAIKLHGHAIPPPGGGVSVRYHEWLGAEAQEE